MGARKPATFEVIEWEGRQARRYADGSIRDALGRMLKPLDTPKPITKENAASLVARKLELKRDRVKAGANAAVASHKTYGELFDGSGADYIEAMSQAVTEKALNPKDPKQTDAFRAILQETGEAERVQLPDEAAPPGAAMVAALTEFLKIVKGFIPDPPHETLEGVVVSEEHTA